MEDSKKIILNTIKCENYVIDFTSIDWEEVLSIIVNNKIFFHTIEDILPYIPKKHRLLFDQQKRKYIDRYNKNIEIMKSINSLFKKECISFVFSKGILLSKILYTIPYYRVSKDIDIVVKENDFIKACCLLDDLGFIEKNILRYSKRIKCVDKRTYYKKHIGEVVFFNNDGMKVELKTKIQYFKNNLLEKSWDNIVDVNIQQVNFPCFCLKDMYINILLNSYKNLCTPYGIEFDHRICDIIDYFNFCIKYKEIFTDEFVKTIYTEYSREIIRLYNVIKEFYSPIELKELPPFMSMLGTTPTLFDDMVWGDCEILDRLFNSKKRKYLHQLFRFENKLKVLGQPQKILSKSIHKKDWNDITYDSNLSLFFEDTLQYQIECSNRNLLFVFKKIDPSIDNIKFILRYVEHKESITFKELYIDISNGMLVNGEDKCAHISINNDELNILIPLEKLLYDIDGRNLIFFQFEYQISENGFYQNVASIGNLYDYKIFELV